MSGSLLINLSTSLAHSFNLFYRCLVVYLYFEGRCTNFWYNSYKSCFTDVWLCIYTLRGGALISGTIHTKAANYTVRYWGWNGVTRLDYIRCAFGFLTGIKSINTRVGSLRIRLRIRLNPRNIIVPPLLLVLAIFMSLPNIFI